MSIAVLFKKPKPATFGKIVLDALLTATHEMESDVTEFPVEEGAPITDHIWAKPRRFTMTGFVTNTPVKILGARLSQESYGTDGRLIDVVQKTFAMLEEMHVKRELIEVKTKLRTYKNMAIERITCNLDAQTGASLPFTAQLVEVRIVRSQAVAFNIARKPASQKAAKTAQTGKATPAVATPKATEKVSLLKNAINSAGKLF